MKMTLILLMGLSVPFALGAGEKMITFQSPKTQVKLLELYSTQSCSSCPPAQAWVSELRTHPGLWKKFAPVVLHVDYWDYLGWKDPYSKAQFTKRQREYARVWRARKIYTPMFVLNGSEWRGRNLSELINQTSEVGVLEVRGSKGSGKFEVRFSPKAQDQNEYRLFATVMQNGVKTKVTRGENSGKTLAHDFIVLDLRETKLKKKEKQFIGKINLDLKPRESKQKRSLVFWVTKVNDSRLVQAVGGDLDKGMSL